MRSPWSLLQAKQAQFPQPFFIGEVLLGTATSFSHSEEAGYSQVPSTCVSMDEM